MKILTIVGARPQFIKAAAVSRVIRAEYAGRISEVLVHTGQHYDKNMSSVFFDELEIPHPKFNLGISGCHHGVMTGRMIEAIEKVFLDERPDCVQVYGDTNSTLAGALAAIKLHIPIAHVEAGLRSFNMKMPEEVNRILTDRISTILFCPTDTAVENLNKEGIVEGVHNVGDVMFDVAIHYREKARNESNVMEKLGISDNNYVLATCHRAENTDNVNNLREIFSALSEISKTIPVVLPLHPRTREALRANELTGYLESLVVTDPLPFLDMVALEQGSKVILTDSGGVQKEAFFYDVPCITMREETEWVETVRLGRNRLAGASRDLIIDYFSGHEDWPKNISEKPYGDGSASSLIVNEISRIS